MGTDVLLRSGTFVLQNGGFRSGLQGLGILGLGAAFILRRLAAPYAAVTSIRLSSYQAAQQRGRASIAIARIRQIKNPPTSYDRRVPCSARLPHYLSY